MERKDHCSWFPENIYLIVGFFKFKKIYIGGCCEGHDKDCSFWRFANCLASLGVKILCLPIAIGGEIGCWVRHFKWQIDKMKGKR